MIWDTANASIKIHILLLVSSCLPWSPVVMRLKGGFMSPSCPAACVWLMDFPPCSLELSESPAAAAPPGHCRPRGSCMRNWCCLQETFPALLWWMRRRWRSDDEEDHVLASHTPIGWGGHGAGRWAQPWCSCCGWCWWRDRSLQTYRQWDGEDNVIVVNWS